MRQNMKGLQILSLLTLLVMGQILFSQPQIEAKTEN